MVLTRGGNSRLREEERRGERGTLFEENIPSNLSREKGLRGGNFLKNHAFWVGG